MVSGDSKPPEETSNEPPENDPQSYIPVTHVELSESSVRIENININITLEATVYPDEASIKDTFWKSSDSSIASVKEGVITGHKGGTAIITVTAVSGGRTATCNVEVVQPVSSVELRQDITLGPNRYYQLEPILYPSNANYTECTWSSDDETAVKVNATGRLSTHDSYTSYEDFYKPTRFANITVTVDGKTAVTKVVYFDLCQSAVDHDGFPNAYSVHDAYYNKLKNGDNSEFSWSVSGTKTFDMGSPTNETHRRSNGDNNETRHNVRVGPYKMLGYEIPQGIFDQVMIGVYRGNSYYEVPEYLHNSYPVSASWYEAIEFCNRLSIFLERAPVYEIKNIVRDIDGNIKSADVNANWTANGYRLPTEVEMESAIRFVGSEEHYFTSAYHPSPEFPSGNYMAYPFGATFSERDWPTMTQPRAVKVKSYAEYQVVPDIELYHIIGNMWEWCWDAVAPYPTAPSGTINDPRGDSVSGNEDKRRVRGGAFDSLTSESGWLNGIEGGTYYYDVPELRAAHRESKVANERYPNVGFRIVINGN